MLGKLEIPLVKEEPLPTACFLSMHGLCAPVNMCVDNMSGCGVATCLCICGTGGYIQVCVGGFSEICECIFVHVALWSMCLSLHVYVEFGGVLECAYVGVLEYMT